MQLIIARKNTGAPFRRGMRAALPTKIAGKGGVCRDTVALWWFSSASAALDAIPCCEFSGSIREAEVVELLIRQPENPMNDRLEPRIRIPLGSAIAIGPGKAALLEAISDGVPSQRPAAGWG